MTDDGLIEGVVMALWPVLGGNHLDPEVWRDIGSTVRDDILPIIKREREAERTAIVAWLRESAAWHDKHDDGLSGFDGIRQGQTEAADAIEAGEHHAR